MSLLSNTPEILGNTPLVCLQKVIKPHKLNPSTWEIKAKCEYRNPSGSIWDRLTNHEMKSKTGAFVTGGVNDLCLSLAWAAGVVPTASSGSGKEDDVTISVLPGGPLNDTKMVQLKGLGAHVILSYQQDPNKQATQECLERHVKDLDTTSGVVHHKVMSYPTVNPTERHVPSPGPYDSLVEELDMASTSQHKWDLIVSSAQDPRLLQSLRNKIPVSDTTLIGVDFGENTFTESVIPKDLPVIPGVKRVCLTDAECYDMARRLVREEGLLVGPISGGIMAAALKEICSTPTPISAKRHVLVILPDSLQNSNQEFLSIDWMVHQGYFPGVQLESLFWWYEMALENINPPEVILVTPEISTQAVLNILNTSSLDRGVVVSSTDAGVEERRVIGIVTRDCLLSKGATGRHVADSLTPVGDICIKQFGLIDSKANFSELERQLRKYHWVVNLHRTPVYSLSNSSCGSAPSSTDYLTPCTWKDVLGAINMTDFMRYKKKIEKHHLTSYDIPMSDGIPSDVWLSHFNDHLQKNFKSSSQI